MNFTGSLLLQSFNKLYPYGHKGITGQSSKYGFCLIFRYTYQNFRSINWL